MLDHHLARELTRYADVIYLDPPTSFLTRLRNPAAAKAADGPALEAVEPGVVVARPRVNPLMERRIGKPLATFLTRRTMRRAVRAAQFAGMSVPGRRPVHAVVLPSLNPLFGAVGERHKVFWASDDLVAGAGLMGIDDPALRRRASELPRQADVVAAVSPLLVEDLQRLGVPAVLVPNGVDVEHFSATLTTSPAADLTALVADAGGRAVGFVGHLGDRIDIDLVAAVADRGITVLLVGPVQRTADPARMDALLAHPNVRPVGARPYADLPAVLAATDVWLLPYGDSRFNQASFPLKTLEYLAAGRRVVATDLPAVRWLDTELVSVAGGPAEFADAVETALATPVPATERQERISFAAGHGWSDRVRRLAERIDLTLLDVKEKIS
jgi:teichuronic acid biosynthesis glycosyltransferase TuaH